MEISDFNILIQQVRRMPMRYMAVTAANDYGAVKAACDAFDEGIICPIFIGDKPQIQVHLQKLGYPQDFFEIINEANPLKTPFIACELVAENRASIIMKGYIDTSDFLRGLLNKENGVRNHCRS